MSTDPDDALRVALGALAPPGVLIACRMIAPGDEDALLADELARFRGRATRVRRQSGAARITARKLLASLGLDSAAISQHESGAPVWPSGIVGSLAHDGQVAVAAIARAVELDALGIDVEPAEPLPADIVDIVTTAAERSRYPSAVIESRVLFAVKEAIYKALNPTDGLFLDFHDIEIDLDAGRGRTRQGRDIDIAVITSPRIVAIAFRRAAASGR